MTFMLELLKNYGYVRLRPLTREQIAETNAFLLSRPVYVDAHVPQTERNKGTDRRFNRTDPEAMASACVCVHTDDAIVAPHLLEYGLEYLDLASAYLEHETAVSYSANAFWTRPGDAPLRDDIQSFHCDQDDTRFLALFVFLTDVLHPADGPQDLVGTDRIMHSIYGPAGTVFIADTMRLHRGRKPTAGERGVAWWRWGVSERPAANAWDKIEPISARMLGDRYPTDQRLRNSIRLLVSSP